MNCIEVSEIKDIIKRALTEDIGKGDITTDLLVSKNQKAQAIILTGEEGIVCGIDIARLVFKLLDSNIRFVSKVKDGNRIRKGRVLAKIYGKASSILLGERVALNFLGLLSGIATRTRQFVNEIRGYKVKIMDTRKTLPGLRGLEKYAVRVGGGYNQRFRLDEMVMIKDNHLITACKEESVSCINKLIKVAKEKKPKDLKLEIEVRNLREFKEALRAKPDIIMLDNMKIEDIETAVIIRDNTQNIKRKTLLEASGNINLKNICSCARTGVDFVSLGTLTKDIDSLDFSLGFIEE